MEITYFKCELNVMFLDTYVLIVTENVLLCKFILNAISRTLEFFWTNLNRA